MVDDTTTALDGPLPARSLDRGMNRPKVRFRKTTAVQVLLRLRRERETHTAALYNRSRDLHLIRDRVVDIVQTAFDLVKASNVHVSDPHMCSSQTDIIPKS